MATGGIAIRIDDRDIRELQRQLAAMPQRIPQALAAAINSALPKVKKAMVPEMQRVTTIKSGQRAAKAIGQKKATKTSLFARVTFGRTRGIGARNFEHGFIKGGGVWVKAFKELPKVVFRHGFKGTGIGGNKHLFFRDIRKPKKIVENPNYAPNKGRMMHRLKTIYGANVRAIVERNPKIIEIVNRVASEQIRIRLYSQIDRFLQRTKTAVPALDSLA